MKQGAKPKLAALSSEPLLDDRLISDSETASIIGTSEYEVTKLEKTDPDFPKVVWLGPKTKRRSLREALHYVRKKLETRDSHPLTQAMRLRSQELVAKRRENASKRTPEQIVEFKARRLQRMLATKAENKRKRAAMAKAA